MNQQSSIDVLISDPSTIICDGIAEVLSRQPGLRLVGQAYCGHETLALACTLRPDVLLMERDFPDMDGATVIAILRKRFPAIAVLVLSIQEGDEPIHTALQAGARGYLFKNSSVDVVVQAIYTVHAGEMAVADAVNVKLVKRFYMPDLSRREQEVLRQISLGRSNMAIARSLGITEGTVKCHVNNLLSKLHVCDRTQAVLTGLRRGLVTLP